MAIIRKGKQEDILRINDIYDSIITIEENSGPTTCWVRGIYPTMETALEALEAEELFVVEDKGLVMAAARINKEQTPEYKNANWKYYDVPQDEIMVLHTLVVDPNYSGMGYGSRLINFYENYALDNNCRYLRMDTNVNNTFARKLYNKLGFNEVGEISLLFRDRVDLKLMCLEKYIGD